MEEFPMTTEGYLAAKEWLIETGLWEKVSDQDGFSIVYYANYHREHQ
jgi:hypothetical protein